MMSSSRLQTARLYVLIDAQGPLADWSQRVGGLVRAGVDVLQLRDKRLGDRELLARARHLRALTEGTPTLFVMNDRCDLARLAGADGVHVGQEELLPRDVRAIVGPGMLVGVSTHSIQQAREAAREADYIGVGPIFRSETKAFDRYPGLELLRQVQSEISLPAFAIGGIDVRTLPLVLETGCRRTAVSSAVWRAEDPIRVVGSMKQLLGGA